MDFDKVDTGTFAALEADHLLISETTVTPVLESMKRFGQMDERHTTYTVTARCYKAVDSEFAEADTGTPISTLAQPHPPEIAMSIDRLRAKYPDPKELGFLLMRFTVAKPFARIVAIIKETAARSGLIVVRADENEFHADCGGTCGRICMVVALGLQCTNESTLMSQTRMLVLRSAT